jgi:predicted ATPase/DNA-binding CsgD family transcriptional regulator
VAVARVRDGGARLLTLTGPAGVGKTSVVLHLVAALAARFAAGACVVSLAGVDDAGFVAAIAGALGLDPPGGPSLDGLSRSLRPQQLLLVLDGLDHVGRAALLVAELVGTCPELCVVATRRARLRLSFEHELPLAPLPVPGPADRLDAVAASPAVQLFCERAQAVRPGFALDVGNAAAVAGVCRRVDGLPLALELAALRLKVLSPQGLLDRLAGDLDLLTDAPLDLPARHRTLRAAVDWSVDRLAEREEIAFRRLAPFVGGFTIEAAEAVCAADAAGVLPALERLAEESLVAFVEAESGEPRLTMLETIRAAALARLEASGEEDTVRRAHAEHHRTGAERAVAALDGDDRRGGLDWLERERENLAAAERWFRAAGDHDAALRLAVARGRLALERGPGGAAAELAAALEGQSDGAAAELASALRVSAGADGEAAELCRTNRSLAALALLRVDQLSAVELLEHEPALRGIALWGAGRYEEARAVLGGAVDEARARDDAAAGCLAGLGLAATLVALGERSEHLLAYALACAERVDDRRTLSFCNVVAGWVAAAGDSKAAAALYAEALALAEALGDVVLGDLCVAAAAASHPVGRDAKAAARLLGAAQPLQIALVEEGRRARLATARSALGGAAFAAAFEAGHALSPREAFALYESLVREAAAGYPADLSGREVEVLRLVASGLTDAEVARELVLSVRTVHTHLRTIYRKIGVGSRAAATRFALEQRLA